jgi:hypothetical protein
MEERERLHLLLSSMLPKHFDVRVEADECGILKAFVHVHAAVGCVFGPDEAENVELVAGRARMVCESLRNFDLNTPPIEVK